LEKYDFILMLRSKLDRLQLIALLKNVTCFLVDHERRGEGAVECCVGGGGVVQVMRGKSDPAGTCAQVLLRHRSEAGKQLKMDAFLKKP
jgi:hypothetical protein